MQYDLTEAVRNFLYEVAEEESSAGYGKLLQELHDVLRENLRAAPDAAFQQKKRFLQALQEAAKAAKEYDAVGGMF